MTFIIFIIVLGLLILVHELGHFLAAKRAGVRVDEFGFGYPPRAITLGRRWGTRFSLNWIPFGGFVKIFGENYETESSSDEPSRVREFSAENSLNSRSVESHKPLKSSSGLRFTDVSRGWQAIILVAGVTFNLLFAWFLISLGFLIGVPTSEENKFNLPVEDPRLTIISIIPDSPAENAGLKTGDTIVGLQSSDIALRNVDSEEVSEFITEAEGNIYVMVQRGDEEHQFLVKPEAGLVDERRVIGIQMDTIGTLSLPLHRAIVEGAKTTAEFTYLTLMGILDLISGAVQGTADLSQVTGPVGIVGLVGDATRLGFTYLITFTALISINLAIVNLLPFPALDGGRLLFVGIESVTKRPINPRIASTLNFIGFSLLLILMAVITYRDIVNLF